MSEQSARPFDPPTDSARELFHELNSQRAAGRIALKLDYGRLNHMDCPVGSEADGNIWAYAVLALALVALWRGGWWAALAVAAFGIAAYYSLGQTYVRRRMRRRIEERALADLDLWQKLWRFGGVTLAAGAAECAAPAGNWMALVRSLRS